MEDYESAAIRHYIDARTLKDIGRLDNAGHLIGFAAECAIKYRIETLRPSQNKPHGHLPELLVIARKHLGTRGNFTSMFTLLKTDIFRSWHVNRRYFETGNISSAELAEWFEVTKMSNRIQY